MIFEPWQDRLWRRVEIGAHWECWVITGHHNRDGYGVLSVDGNMQLAHRLVWVYTFGPIPPGMCVLHRCDNPPCCNPDDLFLGTQADNMRDMAAKGRHWESQKARCPQGHFYEGDNLYIDSGGSRECRACTRERVRKYRQVKEFA
jgi:hypothetical protein